jgi:hypothetical protein
MVTDVYLCVYRMVSSTPWQIVRWWQLSTQRMAVSQVLAIPRKRKWLIFGDRWVHLLYMMLTNQLRGLSLRTNYTD